MPKTSSLKKRFRRWLRGYSHPYVGDVFGTKVNASFLDEPAFEKAWNTAIAQNDGCPDIRWRCHTCIWAAKRGLELGGDFVDCGVYGGVLALTIAEYFGFRNGGPKHWLFDTFQGLPLAQLPADEIEFATKVNRRRYQDDVYSKAQRNFALYPNARLVRGALPRSLDDAPELKKIAYLSMDLNSASAERDTIKELWDRIISGAIIVLDDYAFPSHVQQYDMWNQFAQSKNRSILTLPTGQGLIIK